MLWDRVTVDESVQNHVDDVMKGPIDAEDRRRGFNDDDITGSCLLYDLTDLRRGFIGTTLALQVRFIHLRELTFAIHVSDRITTSP